MSDPREQALDCGDGTTGPPGAGPSRRDVLKVGAIAVPAIVTIRARSVWAQSTTGEDSGDQSVEPST
ncbi:MAG TPA: hypothetical protein VNN07_13330 [Candidatus Tectomicrobia bacterium]|nr:hypothetical protein [Candidatus Tectomicrobia bacterium]